MKKYPRTPHIRGSAIQRGDKDLESVPFDDIKKKFLVIEEKVDGSNCGISFDNGEMMLQSRGHYLVGNDHRQFDMFKSWAFCMEDRLYEVLRDRYIMYGEWLFAKHTIFYDALPHYFLEFDIYDRDYDVFLGTITRHEMLIDLGIVSVPVLKCDHFKDLESLVSLIGPSAFKSDKNHHRFAAAVEAAKLEVGKVWFETDDSFFMEGLYIKDETSGRVDARYKWVRSSFLQTIKDSGSHWMNRRIVRNCLDLGVDIYK